MSLNPKLCQAIRSRSLIEFDYDGHHRIVAPNCYGATRKGIDVLRAIQVGGSSRSGGFGFGKLWQIGKILNLHSTEERFLPTDPHYNPDDPVMSRIYCRV